MAGDEMTDRIDNMSHEELKAATRELLEAIKSQKVREYSPSEVMALKAFRPTIVMRIEEILRAEGWGMAATSIRYGGNGDPGPHCITIESQSGITVWSRP
jgi:hypothetical protein